MRAAAPSGREGGIELGGDGESAARFVTDQGQSVHEQRVADEVDLLAEAANAVSSSEEKGVLEVAVDRFGVVPARVEPGEVGTLSP
jgi:hypothetical protein